MQKKQKAGTAPLAPPPRSAGCLQQAAGFSLLEVLIALVVLSLGLALAAQVLAETAQMLADAGIEARDPLLPPVLARLRGDVRAATGYAVLPGLSGEGPRLLLAGLPSGDAFYGRQGDELIRWPAAGPPEEGATLMRGVTRWSCYDVGPRLVRIDLSYLHSLPRHTPLPTLPGVRGPVQGERTETLFLAPRGAGLGESW